MQHLVSEIPIKIASNAHPSSASSYDFWSACVLTLLGLSTQASSSNQPQQPGGQGAAMRHHRQGVDRAKLCFLGFVPQHLLR